MTVYILFENDGEEHIVGVYNSEKVANEALSYCEESNQFPKYVGYYVERRPLRTEAFWGVGKHKVFSGDL